MRSVELLVLVHVSRAPIGAHHVAHVWVRGVRWDESLSLRRNGCENALLSESRAVLALARRVILETRAANLSLRQLQILEALLQLAIAVATMNLLTLRLLQYLHAIAVRCLGADWLKAICGGPPLLYSP